MGDDETARVINSAVRAVVLRFVETEGLSNDELDNLVRSRLEAKFGDQMAFGLGQTAKGLRYFARVLRDSADIIEGWAKIDV